MSAVALRRARNPDIGVFFFIAFSFAPAYAKEKARRASDFFFWLLAVLGLYLVGVGAVDALLLSRGEHCSLAKNHKDTFSFIVLFNDEKYQKSFKRAFLPLKNLLPRARVCRTSHAWRVRAARDRVKVGSFAALRNLDYTTRANISHEIAEQIRARIACTPAESARRAWVESVR